MNLQGFIHLRCIDKLFGCWGKMLHVHAPYQGSVGSRQLQFIGCHRPVYLLPAHPYISYVTTWEFIYLSGCMHASARTSDCIIYVATQADSFIFGTAGSIRTNCASYSVLCIAICAVIHRLFSERNCIALKFIMSMHVCAVGARRARDVSLRRPGTCAHAVTVSHVVRESL